MTTRAKTRRRPQLETLEGRALLSGAGSLDPTFNPGGSPPGTAILSLSIRPSAVLVQPSGEIVLAGMTYNAKNVPVFAAAELNPNGSLNPSLGSGGKAVPTFSGKWLPQRCYAAALYPTGTAGDAKILEVGVGVSSSGQGAFALVRYNANGSLDTSFGSGGLVITTFSRGSTGAAGVVVEPDGKIVLAGDNGSGFELARYNPNGSLDTTFGSGGTVYTPVASGTSQDSLAQAANGDLIVVGGVGASDSQSQAVIADYTANGALDPSFGNNGFVYNSSITQARDVKVYPPTDTTGNAGKMVVTGYGPGPANYNTQTWGFDVARYNPNGTVDTTFNGTGQVSTIIPNFSGSVAWPAAIQSDGKIVVGGYTYQNTGGNQSALIRYNTNGSLDSTFGAGGIVTTAVGPSSSRVYALALQPDGNILAAGYAMSAAGTQQWDVARYQGSATTTAAPMTIRSAAAPAAGQPTGTPLVTPARSRPFPSPLPAHWRPRPRVVAQ